MRGLSIQRRQNGVLQKCPPPILRSGSGSASANRSSAKASRQSAACRFSGSRFSVTGLTITGRAACLSAARPRAPSASTRRYAGETGASVSTPSTDAQQRTAHTSRRKPPRSSLFYSIRERMCRIDRLAQPLVKAVCRAGLQSALIECRPQQREQCVLRQSDRRFTAICGLFPHGASRRRQERCAEREIAVSQMRSQQTR